MISREEYAERLRGLNCPCEMTFRLGPQIVKAKVYVNADSIRVVESKGFRTHKVRRIPRWFRCYRWEDISDDAKWNARNLYGYDKMLELVYYSDSLWNEYGVCMAY